MAVYSGYMNVSSWLNFWGKENDGSVWGNYQVTANLMLYWIMRRLHGTAGSQDGLVSIMRYLIQRLRNVKCYSH